jgi:hypothetical protein
MFIDTAAHLRLALQWSTMFPALNMRDRPRSAPTERGNVLELVFYKHYVPTERGVG